MSCQGCKFWSEHLAQSIGGGPVEAMCLNPESPRKNRYEHRGCEKHTAGAAIDDPSNDEPDYDDFDDDLEGGSCHYCGGEGWGIVGTDWDCSDGINGPYNGEIEQCPCCHGSGLAKDCTFW